MTIERIFEEYCSIQDSVKEGYITPAKALEMIAGLQTKADTLKAGFKFTQSLEDLETLAESQSGIDSFPEEVDSFQDDSSY